MSENSAISWTDHTFNPWEGCTKVSPGCANCYAENRNIRFSGGINWGKGAPRRRTSKANWKLPVKWNMQAKISNSMWRAGISLGNTEKELLERGFIKPRRPRVFCASLADWLDDEVPALWLADLMKIIQETPELDWLLLTKRPQNFAKRIEAAYMKEACGSIDADQMMYDWHRNGIAPSNVWIGTTVEDQQRADERIPELLKIPARVRFLSCEPLLEKVDLRGIAGIDWIIVGGESGPGFRPFNPDWARSLRDQSAGAAFHMKQMGGLKPSTMPPIPQDLMIREFPQP